MLKKNEEYVNDKWNRVKLSHLQYMSDYNLRRRGER